MWCDNVLSHSLFRRFGSFSVVKRTQEGPLLKINLPDCFNPVRIWMLHNSTHFLYIRRIPHMHFEFLIWICHFHQDMFLLPFFLILSLNVGMFAHQLNINNAHTNATNSTFPMWSMKPMNEIFFWSETTHMQI